MWTRDLRDAVAMLYQLSYEATHWDRGQLIEFISYNFTENRKKEKKNLSWHVESLI